MFSVKKLAESSDYAGYQSDSNNTNHENSPNNGNGTHHTDKRISFDQSLPPVVKTDRKYQNGRRKSVVTKDFTGSEDSLWFIYKQKMGFKFWGH